MNMRGWGAQLSYPLMKMFPTEMLSTEWQITSLMQCFCGANWHVNTPTWSTTKVSKILPSCSADEVDQINMRGWRVQLTYFLDVIVSKLSTNGSAYHQSGGSRNSTLEIWTLVQLTIPARRGRQALPSQAPVWFQLAITFLDSSKVTTNLRPWPSITPPPTTPRERQRCFINSRRRVMSLAQELATPNF